MSDSATQLPDDDDPSDVNPDDTDAPAPPLRNTHLQEMIQFARVGYVLTDRRGVVMAANQSAAELLNVTKSYLLDKPLAVFVHAEDFREFYQVLARLGRDRHGDRRIYDFRVRRGDLTTTPTRMRYLATSVEVVDAGEPGERHYRWLLRDFSQTVVETELESERSFADTLLDIVPAFVLAIAPNGEILRANRWAENWLVRPPDRLIRQPWTAFLPLPDHADADLILWHAFRTGGIDRLRTRLHVVNGGPRTVTWSFKPYQIPSGEATMLALGYDVTEFEEAQTRMLLHERLAAIGQFVTTLAHESRNALQRAKACLQRLAWRLENQAEPLDLVARTRCALVELRMLFDDVRIFAHDPKLHLEKCELPSIWREAWDQIADVRSSMPSFVETAPPDLPPCRVDRLRVLQVFRNLYDNAIDAGAKSVEVWAKSNDSIATLRIAVRDDGRGIDPQMASRLFDPFVTTKSQGSGLGLSICKRTIEAHGGQISIRGTEVAVGAEVLFTLPRDQP